MNKFVKKVEKEDFFFCDHYINIQIDFLYKLYQKTENPMINKYILKLLKKSKDYRFWKIIRPIIVDRKLDLWRIKFSHLPGIDIHKRILYLPNFYPRYDISYTFKFFRHVDIDKYIELHLNRIEKIITTNINILYCQYKDIVIKKYNNKKNEIYKHNRNRETTDILISRLKITKISKLSIKRIHAKSVLKYIEFVDRYLK